MKHDELRKLGKAIEYMRLHYQSQIKAGEISEYCGLTPRALNRIMSDKFGCTFSVLLRKYRLCQAVRLLHFDYIPIEIVAKRCGFRPTYFTSEFKKEFGRTPKEMKGETLFPDMPIFKEIDGYPLSLEYRETEAVTLEGYPINIPKGEQIDLMWDVAYGFRHPNGKTDLTCKERTWGIWWYDEEEDYRLQYLMAQKVDPDAEPDPAKVRAEIPGGRYAIFSVDRGHNWFETADHAREMAWHAFYAWQILSFKETDKWAFTYEVFDEEKLYLYVPLLSGYGGIEREKEFGSHTIDRIIHYIDEHILDDTDPDEDIRQFVGHDAFYREQFQSCYGLSLKEYIERKRLYVLADALYSGRIRKSDIMKVYHYDSFLSFEKSFRRSFHVSSREYHSVNIELIDLDAFYEENMKKMKIEKLRLDGLRFAGKVVKSRTDRKSRDSDLPQMTAFWMTNDFNCYEGLTYEEAKERIAIYRTGSGEDGRPAYDYVIGAVLKEGEEYPEELQEILIEGGPYYAFSYMDKEGDKISLTDQIRDMVRYIDHVWIYRNWLRTDFTRRVSFYYYDGERIFYYVPVYG